MSSAKRNVAVANHAIDDQAVDWQSGFLRLLPAIYRQTKRHFRHLHGDARSEAVQEAVVDALMAYRRLVLLGKADVAYATPLASYACRQFYEGRRVSLRQNSQEVTSPFCQRRQSFAVLCADDWQDQLLDHRRSTPADLAAMRIDFAAWLRTLDSRERRLVRTLARGESGLRTAKLFRITAGRVSQLRRELLQKWRRFVGDEASPQVAAV